VRASESVCAGDCHTKRTCRGVRLRRQSVCVDLVQIEEKCGARRVRQLTGSLRVLQCVTVCCSVLQAANSQAHSVCYSVLQCVAVCCRPPTHRLTPCVAVCCSVLQCVAGCQLTGSLRVLQCVTVCCSVLQCVVECGSVWQCVTVCCTKVADHPSALQCVAVAGVLQCVAGFCCVLQCITVT